MDITSLDISVSLLLWGLVFSSIGLGYFLYGKKQKHTVALVCGLVLMIYPYFIYNVYMLVLVGIIVTAIPYFWRE